MTKEATTVWEIGSIVYGVHTEVENHKCTIYIIKEKIIEFYENGGWKSEGKVNGVRVFSEMIKSAYDTKDQAYYAAESVAEEAESQIGTGAWDEVIRNYSGLKDD